MTARFFAPAKINLSLRVFPPDPTGYHPIDSLFCALALTDEIEIDFDGDRIELDVAGADLGPLHGNLAYRAADEFFRTTNLPPRLRVRLRKRIPVGGGLGGGSSDAAAVLGALNRHYGQVLPEADLLSIAARLGSDVAFFLCGSSFAHVSGYGEILRPLPPLPAADVIVLVPSFSINTGEAYGWIDRARAYSDAQTATSPPADWDEVERIACNAFEPVVFERHARLAELKRALQSAGARITLLSGSGSTVFGVFSSKPQRAEAAARLQAVLQDVAVVATTTLA